MDAQREAWGMKRFWYEEVLASDAAARRKFEELCRADARRMQQEIQVLNGMLSANLFRIELIKSRLQEPDQPFEDVLMDWE